MENEPPSTPAPSSENGLPSDSRIILPKATGAGSLADNTPTFQYARTPVPTPAPIAIRSARVVSAAGDVVGPFTLVKLLGQGGFGEVWEANQLKPLKRTVALKLIKPNMASSEVLKRFDAERQAVAAMDHPNIARVYDAGATEDGRPWFAMEIVDGLPLTTYCDRKKLTVQQRLALFMQVCAAVQHAHHKGVIHRDLKPSNIIITESHGEPVPKVIDFGIAKALSSDQDPLNGESILVTRDGLAVGTPEYMSPEQAGATSDLDTRSDIYTLGVILYELMTGSTPLAHENLARVPFLEMLRHIRDTEPQRPSSRLTQVTEKTMSVSNARDTEPPKLCRMLRGDIDWIVLKSLEKERTRRYASANDLALDIGRHLENEPVSASPPSTLYRLGKMVRRNKAAVAAAVVAVFCLIGGLGAAVWQAQSARREMQHARNAEKIAEDQKKRAEEEQARAEDEQRRAEEEKAVARSVTDFLQEDLLQQASPAAQVDRGYMPNPDLTITEALKRAASGISGRFDGQPLVEASIRTTIGVTYVNLGDPDTAMDHLRRAVDLRKKELGEDDADTLLCMSHLAAACRDAGKTDEAIKLAEEVLAHRKKVLSADHPDVLAAMETLASIYKSTSRPADAMRLYDEALRVKKERYGDDDASTLETMNNLASACLDAGNLKRALSLLETAYKVRMSDYEKLNHPDTLLTMYNFALACRQAGRLEEALSISEQAFNEMRKTYGSSHPHTMRAGRSFAAACVADRQFAKAVPLLDELLKLTREKSGENHTDARSLAMELATARNEMEKAATLAEAKAKADQATKETAMAAKTETPSPPAPPGQAPGVAAPPPPSPPAMVAQAEKEIATEKAPSPGDAPPSKPARPAPAEIPEAKPEKMRSADAASSDDEPRTASKAKSDEDKPSPSKKAELAAALDEKMRQKEKEREREKEKEADKPPPPAKKATAPVSTEIVGKLRSSGSVDARYAKSFVSPMNSIFFSFKNGTWTSRRGSMLPGGDVNAFASRLSSTLKSAGKIPKGAKLNVNGDGSITIVP